MMKNKKDFKKNPMFGMRKDIKDSVKWVNKNRKKAERYVREDGSSMD